MRILILGGTTEATELGRVLAGDGRVRATISLAGRTRSPLPQKLPTRTGGFGGVAGLACYLEENRIEALIDATHPFAARMTANAVEAARMTATPLLVVLRPAWRPVEGDRWVIVADMPAAAAALGEAPRRVFLTIGQKDLSPFRAAPKHHYVLRSVDPPPPEALPPDVDIIAARGPFAEADEHRLLVERRIEVVVTKNSGGGATEAKLATARALGVPVVMVERPPAPPVDTVDTVADVLAWLERRHAGAPRGE
jgi:precorrin-6A/cobalt-precorrin-6A reductase